MDVARHLRIVATSIDDDFVSKRTTAIGELSELYRKRTGIDQVLVLADSLVRTIYADPPVPTDELRAEAAGRIGQHAPSFVDDENSSLEIAVVSILAAGQAIVSAKPSGNLRSAVGVLALSVSNGLLFGGQHRNVRVEALRAELLENARQFLVKHSAIARGRRKIEPIPQRTAQESVEAYLNTFSQAATQRIESLQENAVLDREELNALWWALNDWSYVLNKAISKTESTLAALVAGIELGSELTAPPGIAHRQLASRNVASAESIPLASLRVLSGPDADSVFAALGPSVSTISKAPQVFPIFSRVMRVAADQANDNGSVSTQSLAHRALDEAALMRAAGTLDSTVIEKLLQ